MPSLACASATAARQASQPRSSTPPAQQSPVAEAASEAPGGCGAAAGEAMPKQATCPAVDARNAVYLLNPSGDLPATQATFESLFRQQHGWQVWRDVA